MSTQFAIAAVLLAAPGVGRADEWTPPEKPNPHSILDGARVDARAGDYETALAKHVWFHENALKYDESLTGVRLSFALGYWFQLAEAYPPAMAKLIDVRDDARRRVEENHDERVVFEHFQELAAINDRLGEADATVDAFRWLDERDSPGTRRVYRLAQPSLVLAKEYALCGKYLEPEPAFERMADSYRHMREYEGRPRAGVKSPPFAAPNFINEVATLVALLVVNERQDEADDIVLAAKKVSLETRDDAFDADLADALEGALDGTVPEPWP
jgi:hypothetical protein